MQRVLIGNIGLLFAAFVLLLSFAALPAGACVWEGTYTVDADFDQGIMDGVNHEEVHDQLQLNKKPTTFPFAWIANSGEGTVSKIDTQTGQEVARYRTGPQGGAHSPSRTAVDVDGNCWVANRAYEIQGTVVKILCEGGIDRNGDGQIDTSTGPGDVKPWGEDERVVLSIPVGNPRDVPRAIAIDAAGNVWVGLYNACKYVVLDGATGAWIADVPVAGNPYGAVIDSNGILWSARPSWGLDKVDTISRTYVKSYEFGGGYGVTVDRRGLVWEGAYPSGGVYRFTPWTESVQHCPSGTYNRGRGVCADDDDNIWVALGYGSPNNKVAKYDGDGNLLAVYDVGVNPCGVGTDYDGNIIVVCQSSQDVYKIDKNTGAVIWQTPVGATPYTYSDFTGFIVRNITQQTGTWTVVFDSQCAGTPWGTATWTSDEPQDTSVTVQVRSADSVTDLPTQAWLDVANGVDFGPIYGRYIEIKARLSTKSQISPVLYDLSIKAANQPPDCSTAYASVGEIWPPNHQMVPVSILGVTDPDGDPVTITITGITQDEPLNGLGDGDTSPDGAGIGTSTALLRAERSGTSKTPGNGRVYRISFSASDGKGGICEGSVDVCVPHDMRPGHTCVDDGQNYNSVGP